MVDDTTQPEMSEFARMLHAIQSAVVWVNPDESGQGGIIDMQIATDALLYAFADLLVRSGHVTTPRDARTKGEETGKTLGKIMKALIEDAQAGHGETWKMEPIGKVS